MENLTKKIKSFLANKSTGYGYGYGVGSCYEGGYSLGCGYGSGSGYSSGDGYGCGNSAGSGYVPDLGTGYGYVSGDCSGIGFGVGYGCASNIKSINSQSIYYIDNLRTIILSIHNNIAKGYIVNEDFSIEKCYIVKRQNKFAHGKTIQKAVQALQEKIYEDMDIDEVIAKFRKKFKKSKKYKASEFYSWHHFLTGSCEMGRKNFMKNHNIDEDYEYSVQEFIKMTENEFGGANIRLLKKYYQDD